jgi:hypothetical protein
METLSAARPAGPEKKRNHALTATLCVLAVLLAALLALSFLVLNDPLAGRGYETAEPSGELAKTFLQQAVKGGEASFSAEEVNGFLAYLIQEHRAGTEKNGVQLLAAAVTDGSGDSADVYLPVLYRDHRFGILLNVTPTLDSSAGKLLFRVNSAKIGRLAVPAGWLLEKAESRLPEGFSRDGDTVWCEAPSASASVLTVKAAVKLKEFRMEDGNLKLAAEMTVSLG